MKKQRLIIVCGSLYRRDLKTNISSSGSDISMEEQIESMVEYAEHIDVITLTKDGIPEYEELHEGVVRVHRVDEESVPSKISELHSLNGNETDAIITQLLLCDIALREAKRLKIKSIYYIRSFGSNLPLKVGEELEPDVLVGNSEYVAKTAEELYGKKAVVSYSSYANRSGVDIKPYYDFMMFNPNGPKGGSIFLEIVKRYPEQKFFTVLGWQDLKAGDGKFDYNLMKLMSNAHGEKEVYIPEDFELPELPNLTVSKPVPNGGELIKNSRCLLIPSQWHEAFPRVLIEAGINGRHAIASNIGGIKEGMGIAGMPKEYLSDLLIDDYSNPEAWFKAIDWYMEVKESLPLPVPVLPRCNLAEVLGVTSND